MNPESHVPEIVAPPVLRLRFASYSAATAARELTSSRHDTWRRASRLCRAGKLGAGALKDAVGHLPAELAADVRREFAVARRLAARRAAFARRPGAHRQAKGKRRGGAAVVPAAKAADEPPVRVGALAREIDSHDQRALVDVFRTLNMLKRTLDEATLALQHVRLRVERDAVERLRTLEAVQDGAHLVTAARILELAKTAKTLCRQRSSEEQRDLLAKVGCNSRLKGRSVRYNLQNPFAVLAENARCS